MAVSAGLSYLGSRKAAKGFEDTGEAARERGRKQRAQYYVTAKNVMASGQQAMFEDKRQAELVASRAVAVAAAGGYIQDIDHLIADIYGEGAYRASLAMREAEMEAESLRFAGDQAEQYGADQYDLYKGRAKAAKIQGVTGLISSATYAGFGGFGVEPTGGRIAVPGPHR
jgi:hypothetical protein